MALIQKCQEVSVILINLPGLLQTHGLSFSIKYYYIIIPQVQWIFLNSNNVENV